MQTRVHLFHGERRYEVSLMLEGDREEEDDGKDQFIAANTDPNALKEVCLDYGEDCKEDVVLTLDSSGSEEEFKEFVDIGNMGFQLDIQKALRNGLEVSCEDVIEEEMETMEGEDVSNVSRIHPLALVVYRGGDTFRYVGEVKKLQGPEDERVMCSYDGEVNKERGFVLFGDKEFDCCEKNILEEDEVRFDSESNGAGEDNEGEGEGINLSSSTFSLMKKMANECIMKAMEKQFEVLAERAIREDKGCENVIKGEGTTLSETTNDVGASSIVREGSDENNFEFEGTCGESSGVGRATRRRRRSHGSKNKKREIDHVQAFRDWMVGKDLRMEADNEEHVISILSRASRRL